MHLAVFVLVSAGAVAGCGSDGGSGPPVHPGPFGDPGSGGKVSYQPLDGGSHTWSNGVRMTVRVEKTEPWGDYDDYCGDGSCGVSHKDDLRLVLAYDVSVPASASRPLDAGRCPGELKAVNGSDDDLVISVAGQYYHPIHTVLPGATENGTQEFSIDRSLVGQEFVLTSDCGGETGDTAYFRGVVDDGAGASPSASPSD